MTINLGPAFEQDLITIAGWNNIEPGTTTIDFINTTGQTTVRATITTTVDTPTLQALITKYATPATPTTLSAKLTT